MQLVSQSRSLVGGLGSLDQFNNAFGDFLEKVGEKAAPLIVAVTKKLTAFTEQLQVNEGALSGISTVIKAFAQSLAVIKNALQIAGKAVGTFLGFFVELGNVGLTEFDKLKEMALLFGQEMKQNVLDTKLSLEEDLALIDELSKAKAQERNLNHLKAISKQNKDQAKIDVQEQKRLDAEKKKAQEKLLKDQRTFFQPHKH